MKAVVMAGGEGRRMRPLTATRPKALVPAAGRPLIDWVLDGAERAGCSEAYVVTSYMADVLEAHLARRAGKMRVQPARQRRPLGTADALRTALEHVSGPFLLLSCDTLVPQKGLDQLARSKGLVLGSARVADLARYGKVHADGQRVTAITEKPAEGGPGLANTGVYRLDDSIAGMLPSSVSERGEFELTDALHALAREGLLSHTEMPGWTDVGAPWDLLAANETLLANLPERQEGTVEDGVTIHGRLIVAQGARVLAGTYVEGNVFVGYGSKVGPNCHLRGATAIGAGCHVGAATEIKNSILLDGAKAPHHNYVGDSVLGANVNLGSGTKVANLRLDERTIRVSIEPGKVVDTGRKKFGCVLGDGVHTGINASINVGTIIGEEAHVGPGVVASGHVPARARVL